MRAERREKRGERRVNGEGREEGRGRGKREEAMLKKLATVDL